MTSASVGGAGAAVRGTAGSVPAQDGNAFAKVLQQAGTPDLAALADVQVRRGDTLIGVVQQAAAAQGKTVSGAQAWRMAQQLASSNGIDDPNLILPGQRLRMAAVGRELAALPTANPAAVAARLPASASVGASAGVQPSQLSTQAAHLNAPVVSTQAALALRMTTALSANSQHMLERAGASPLSGSNALNSLNSLSTTAGRLPRPPANAYSGRVVHVTQPLNRRLTNTPVLDKTLQRAVDKGFMTQAEVPHVQQKIMALAHKHQFAPDDFARLTLMESDGMNPQSTNGSCHGIIQFCDGNSRGAATVGFANNPRAILGMSTYKQLDLVDKYFEEVGVGKKGPVRLDDLYLSVLTPKARQESRRHVPLDIAGTQAAYLHVGKDRDKPITRQSIWAGLHHNANQRLRGVELSPAMRAGRDVRVSAYNTAMAEPRMAQR
ncbi:MAG: hypothetical protein NWS83_09710 [Burkholderiaceae bacterium]|nr:hypothetical protein [Burkholderiaceae bacterium]